MTFDLGLNLKQSKQGKKKKKKRKKKRSDETKDDGKQRSLQMSCCFFYNRQLLIVKFVFFFLEKAEIGHTWCSVNHDSASNQYRLHAWWVIHQVTAFKWVRCYLIRCVIVSSAKRRSSSSLKGIFLICLNLNLNFSRFIWWCVNVSGCIMAWIEPVRVGT